MAAGHISVPKSFSDGDAREWFQRFEICAAANQWDGTLKLPTLLEGEALAIWLELSTEQKADYAVAKEQLIVKMAQRSLSPSKNFTPGS